jgi:nucleotide-binding universal stress UspA family protein
MMQLHSVVAATDLSAPARRAVDRAAALAQAAHASLTLVHVVNSSALNELRRWLESGGEVERSIVEEVRARLHDLAADTAARYRIDVGERMVTGHPVHEIARIAHEREAELVVTGTLGAGLFRHHLLGSTAERVVRKSSRPVLVVRQSPRDPYRRVLVPVDFSRWSAPSLEIARAVAPNAHFVLLHCVTVPFEGRLRLASVDDALVDKYRDAAREEARQRLAELATREGLSRSQWTSVTPVGSNPWMQIVQQEQEQDCDLIAIGKHGRNAVEELLLGSTTNMVIAEGSSDVLVSARTEAS